MTSHVTSARAAELANDDALLCKQAQLADARWNAEASRVWYEKQNWPCGFNYLPASAVNFVEMWQADSFDPARIDLELAWAGNIGLNSPRTNPPFIVWREDRDGFLARLDRFLDLAAGRGMKTVLCLMDDCAFSGEPAHPGPQPMPVTGVHNSRAVASPGREIVMDPSQWRDVEGFVCDVVTRHAQDERVLFWDLYNEPGNRMIFSPNGDFQEFDSQLERFSHQLMLEAFAWCREIAPSQPLTVGGWRLKPPRQETADRIYSHPTDLAAFELSDVVSFHAYSTLPSMQHIIAELSAFERPLMCTEWMARLAGSRVEEQLPLFCANKIGSWHWGLANGRTQTHLPWPQFYHDVGKADATKEWFHDLLYANGEPYSVFEIELIRRLADHYVDDGDERER